LQLDIREDGGRLEKTIDEVGYNGIMRFEILPDCSIRTEPGPEGKSTGTCGGTIAGFV
jgi:hypothetical protein